MAIAIEVVFFALAFGWRSWLQWRRTGATGFIRPRPGAPLAELCGSTGFVIALVLLVAAPVADLMGLDRITALDSTWATIAGLTLAGFGIVLTLVAQVAMGDSWRIGVDPAAHTTLITRGVFARIRNPIFTAMLVATLGLVLLVPNGVSIAAFLVLAAALELQVRFVEEPYLRAVHGDDYDSYQRTAGRFLPGVGTRANT